MSQLTLPTQARRLTGLALPALRYPGGYFGSKTGYDVAWGDLVLALLTPIGSRPMQRDFGSSLHEVLFEPNVPELDSLVRYIVDDTAKKWVPHVEVDDTRVVRPNNTVGLRIAFAIKGQTVVDVREFVYGVGNVIQVLEAAQ